MKRTPPLSLRPLFTTKVRESPAISGYLPLFLDRNHLRKPPPYASLTKSFQHPNRCGAKIVEAARRRDSIHALPLLIHRSPMQDVLMIIFTAVFFALAFLYVKGCQKLR